MSNCPNCSEPIPKQILLEGGNCPRCTELILPSDDFVLDVSDTQEMFPGDDVTDVQGLQFDEYEATELISHAKIRAHGRVLDEEYQEDFPDYDFIDEEGYVPNIQNNVVKPRISWRTVTLLSLLTAVFLWFFFESNKKEVLSPRENASLEDLPTFKQSGDRPRIEKVKEEVVEEEPVVVEPKKVVPRALPEALESNLDKKINKIANCADQQRVGNPKFQASFRYAFTITTEGKVRPDSIVVKEKNKQLKGCVTKKIKRFRFPSDILEGRAQKVSKVFEE